MAYQKADTVRLDSLNEQLEQYQKAANNRRVNELYARKTTFFRSKNDLRAWLDTHWDWQRYHWYNADSALYYLNRCHQEQWRKPAAEPEWVSLLWIYLSEGYQYYNTGAILASIKAYERAEQIYANQQLTGFGDPISYIYKPLGASYTMLGDNERARYLYRKILDLAPSPEKDSTGILAGFYNNIGLTYWNEGDNPAAIKAYQRGLKLQDKGYYLPWYAMALLQSNLALSYLEASDTARASNYALQALAQARPGRGDTDVMPAEKLSSIYWKTAEVLRRAEEDILVKPLYDKALELGRKAYPTAYHRHFSKIYHSLGRYYLSDHQYAEALRYFDQALHAVIPNYWPKGVASLPEAQDFYEENSIFEALEGKADALLAAYEKSQELSLLKTALRCHELTLAADSRLWNALKNESAKAQLQADRRRRVGKGVAIASRLYRATGDVQYNRRAYALVSRSKSKLLQDAIEENLAYRELQQQDSLFKRISNKKQLFATYDKQYQLAQDSTQRWKWLFQKNRVGEELAELEDLLHRRYPNLEAFSADALKENELQKIDSTITLVEYFVGSDIIYAFVLDKGKVPEVHLLPKSSSIETHAEGFVETLKSRKMLENQREKFLRHAHVLYKCLVSPLNLKPGGPLLIIPDGFINYLSFEAMARQADNLPWPEVPFLIKDYEISYTHSCRIYQSLMQSKEQQEAKILLVAPDFTNAENGLQPLRHSGQLGEQLSFIAPRVCGGQEADLQTFTRLAPDYEILHLYTHAEGDSTSGIPKIEFIDSALYLPELYALELDAELVVLSACETGLGRFDGGEGIISLARGFAYAGGRNLAASLWKVNESSTNKIFQSFYENIDEGQPTASALRSAKLEYLSGSEAEAFRKSPYYWAGFVYYGRNASIQFSENSFGYRWILAGIGMLIAVLAWKFARKP